MCWKEVLKCNGARRSRGKKKKKKKKSPLWLVFPTVIKTSFCHCLSN